MNRKRLLTIIESYGADPAHWPEAERAAAERVLRRQPDAGALSARAGGVDAALAHLKAETPDAPPPEFLMRLRAVPARERQRGGSIEVPDWLKAWPQLSSLAAAMMLAGFVVGEVLPAGEPAVEIEMGLALYGTSTDLEIDS